MDAIDLARIQFAFTVSFHFLFPAFTIGLASYLAVLEALWLWTGERRYLASFNYWLKPFAIVFAMGVVSGIVLSYQFGTNWSVFADRVGPVLGPLMAYEVLTAFFLEAGFLGVMLFGLSRVGPRLHFLATLMVAIGTLFSAFWILSANSWMHTPAGFTQAPNGQFLPADWWQVVFNPSFPYRFWHTVQAAYLTTAFAVGGVAAWHLLRDSENLPARTMYSMAFWLIIVVAPLQILAGDAHGLNTLAHQPAKIAAMEGHFETQRGAPLVLFGVPDMATGELKYPIAIPGIGSLLLTHEADGEVRGLEAFPRTDWPNVPIVFFAFRVMVGLGLLMLALGVWGLWLRWRGDLYRSRALQRAALVMGPSGFVAVLAGWFTTEVGRQPFTVYGLLRTSDSMSPIAAPAVAASLAAFVIVYVIVFGAGISYTLRVLAHSPVIDEPPPEPGVVTRTAGITPAPALADAPPHATKE
ncbi:MAG: cytochrome ubiquinol oxidase subunit I [Hyphomicrobiaceae bacterium]